MSLKVWLPLNGTLENKGASNITITNNNATINTNGKIGSCYLFDGTDDFLSLTGINFNSWPQFSFTCWCYPTNTFNSLFLIRGSGAHRIRINSGGFSFRDTNNSTLRTVALGATIPTDTWTHIACIYNHGEVYIYINGNQTAHSASYYNSTSLFLSDLNEIRIARQTATSGSAYYSGKLNDLRIYDHALSAAEVHEISQGLVLHYKLDFTGMNNLLINSNNFTSSNFALTRATVPENGILQVTPTSSAAYGKYKTNLDYDNYNNAIYTLSFDLQEIASSNETYTSYSTRIYYGFNLASRASSSFNSSYDKYTYKTVSTRGEGWNHYSITLNIPNDLGSGVDSALVSGSTLCIQFYRVAKHLPIQVKNIKLEKGSKETNYCLSSADYGQENIVQDSSGYGYNGTILGNLIINSDTARYTTSASFSSNTDGILSTYPVELWNNSFTYSFWIKPSGKNDNRSVYASSYSGTTCSIEKTTSNKLRFYWDGSPDLTTSSLTIIDGIWQHIAVVKSEDKTKVYCYYNGELKDTFTNTFNNKSFSDNLRIARDTRGDATSYTGLISDFRIYCTALSAEDIEILYKVGARIDNKQNLHTFEAIEGSSTIKITKKGQTKMNEVQEVSATKFYSSNNISTNNLIEF